MSSASEKKRRIIEEFAAVRRREYVVVFFVFLGHVGMILDWGEDGSFLGMPHVSWTVLVLVTAAGVALLHYFNWRCPACQGFLKKYPSKACTHCGAQLVE